jgi:hypothetical protein
LQNRGKTDFRNRGIARWIVLASGTNRTRVLYDARLSCASIGEESS